MLGHLRLCAAIPERYEHDSSEEKLYSKYTDVECVTNDYSFVADAKAFRLSRTAKNQKDFKVQAMALVHEVFKSVEAMNPSKNANTYWQIVNRIMLDFDNNIAEIWKDEKRASIESILISREEALGFLASERERVMKLSKAEAIKEVLKSSKIENKIKAIKSVSDNGLFSVS